MTPSSVRTLSLIEHMFDCRLCVNTQRFAHFLVDEEIYVGAMHRLPGDLLCGARGQLLPKVPRRIRGVCPNCTAIARAIAWGQRPLIARGPDGFFYERKGPPRP